MKYLLFLFLTVFSHAEFVYDWVWASNYDGGQAFGCGGISCTDYCKNTYPVGSSFSGVIQSGGIVNQTLGYTYVTHETVLRDDLGITPLDDIYCRVIVEVTPPPACPLNSTYDFPTESCKCTLPYIPSYDLNGTMSCILPDCPAIYEQHQPPLPLFLVTTSVTNCNFFPMADNAVLNLDGMICCYGQEDVDDNTNCALNEIEISGNCYPIDSNNSDSPIPPECGTDSYWSASANQCLPNQDDINGSDAGGDTNTDTNSSTPLPSPDDLLDFMDIADFDEVEQQLRDVVNSYVLVQIPVAISGTCSSEFQRTFTFFGKSYTIDVSKYMSALNDYLPLLKSIILFMFSISGVLIVLSSGRD